MKTVNVDTKHINNMLKLKVFLAKFMLHVYVEYILEEDFALMNLYGRVIIYPFWVFKAVLTWAVCPIFLPKFLFMQTKLYKEIQRVQASPEYQAQLMKSFQMFNNFQ